MHSYVCISITDTNIYLYLDECVHLPQTSVRKYSETDMVSQASGVELSAGGRSEWERRRLTFHSVSLVLMNFHPVPIFLVPKEKYRKRVVQFSCLAPSRSPEAGLSVVWPRNPYIL